MTAFTVLYDACVLYPAPLRDLLMYLSITDLFRAKWTDEIHDEWTKNLSKNRPDITSAQLNNIRSLMNLHVRDCLVYGYEKLIPSLKLPDPDDRHVLAAAIRSSSSIIVTYNLKDFPLAITSEFGIEAQHPDHFLNHLFDLNSSIVCEAIQRLRKRLKSPPLNKYEYIEVLKKYDLILTVEKLKEFFELI